MSFYTREKGISYKKYWPSYFPDTENIPLLTPINPLSLFLMVAGLIPVYNNQHLNSWSVPMMREGCEWSFHHLKSSYLHMFHRLRQTFIQFLANFELSTFNYKQKLFYINIVAGLDGYKLVKYPKALRFTIKKTYTVFVVVFT